MIWAMAAANPARPQDAHPVQVCLDLDPAAQTIQGTVKTPGTTATPFVGWLALTAALERLRAGDGEDARSWHAAALHALDEKR
jgi:hypothetical protein